MDNNKVANKAIDFIHDAICFIENARNGVSEVSQSLDKLSRMDNTFAEEIFNKRITEIQESIMKYQDGVLAMLGCANNIYHDIYYTKRMEEEFHNKSTQ